MKEYKEQLLKELESDKKRKVQVVFMLYFLSLCGVLCIYLSNMNFEEIEKMIIDAMAIDPMDQDFWKAYAAEPLNNNWL